MDNDGLPASAAPTGSGHTRFRWVCCRVGLFVGALAVALLAAPIPTLTWQASAVTTAFGLLVVGLVVIGYPEREGGAKPVTVRAAAPWIVFVPALVVLEFAALAAGSRPEVPTISSFLGPLFVDPTVRVVGYMAWLCTGYWLVLR